jgi:glycosyltransferase involved in cell wall biosynthesis
VGSALAQERAELEIIVVDDGSTDNTREVLAGYKDSRLRVIGQAHQGVAAARNRGIEAGRGEYVALLDSDDEWLPQKLSRQLSFQKEGGWAVTQTEETWIRHGRVVQPQRKHAKKGGWIFAPSLDLCLVSPSCSMFTRRFWEDVGPFDERLPACEDYDLWLRAGLRYPVGLLPEPLVRKYGGHADQLSRRIIGLDLYRIYSLAGLLQRPGLGREQRGLVASALQQRAARYIQGCLKRGKPEEAQRVQDILGAGAGQRA